MHSLAPSFLDGLRLRPEHGSTLRSLGEHRGGEELYRQQVPQALEALRTVAIVESAESSNRLEGVVAPPDRLREVVLRDAQPTDRSEQEIAGYRDALALIHDSAEHMVFTVNVVRQLHQMLYRYQPGTGGRWKATQNDIVERASDGSILRVRFRPVSPVATPGAMDELTGRWARAVDQQREPLILIPLAILDFLCIHPFTDGNGRTARLLTLLLLYRNGYSVGRYISLERVIEDSRDTYYEALERSSADWHAGRHNPFPWLEYFWGTLLRAYDEFRDRAGRVLEGRGSKTALVEAAVARRSAPFAISEIEEECPGVSRDMIRHVLRNLRDDGALEVEGRGRGARWVKIGDG
ncbi:MAG: Fic family protein [Gemmatimonadetes bacterium]|nr:Fic family protein [Gemmatimonadota bacterium]NNL29580.1 Fic family protein [Gemmatimonadota bacterium]